MNDDEKAETNHPLEMYQWLVEPIQYLLSPWALNPVIMFCHPFAAPDKTTIYHILSSSNIKEIILIPPLSFNLVSSSSGSGA